MYAAVVLAKAAGDAAAEVVLRVVGTALLDEDGAAASSALRALRM
eukprot:gene8798-50431_t